MLTTLVVIIIFFLSIQVFPIAVGINVSGKQAKVILLIVVLSLVQAVAYWLGLKLGNSFMHLMDGFKGAVVFYRISIYRNKNANGNNQYT